MIRFSIESWCNHFSIRSKVLAETAGVEPARVWLDCLANSYGYRFITFPNKNSWSEQSDLNRWLTVLQTVAFVRLAMLAWIWQGRRNSNPLELDWKSNCATLCIRPRIRVKRFELLRKLGLSQSPLPLGYTRSKENKKGNTRGKICALHINGFWNRRL